MLATMYERSSLFWRSISDEDKKKFDDTGI